MLSNDVFDKVYTIVKAAMSDLEIIVDDKVVAKWANLNYARAIHELENTTLPCLYIRQIGAPQVGNDLMHNVQNGVDSTFQVETVSDVSYEEAYDIMNDAGDIFIKLGYGLTYGIEEMSTNSPSLWRFVARFNRIVGGQDALTL